MIDQSGRIYEGRWARDYADGEVHSGESPDGLGVVGAHTLNYNTGSCGIVLLGDFTKTPPSDASLIAAMRVLAWKAGQKGIDVSAADQFTNFAGQTSAFPNITGPPRPRHHRMPRHELLLAAQPRSAAACPLARSSA